MLSLVHQPAEFLEPGPQLIGDVPPDLARELCGKVGDGVNQAADLISATASIPSLNFIPLTTFGNWF
jgi:hypothetical protein